MSARGRRHRDRSPRAGAHAARPAAPHQGAQRHARLGGSRLMVRRGASADAKRPRVFPDAAPISQRLLQGAAATASDVTAGAAVFLLAVRAGRGSSSRREDRGGRQRLRDLGPRPAAVRSDQCAERSGRSDGRDREHAQRLPRRETRSCWRRRTCCRAARPYRPARRLTPDAVLGRCRRRRLPWPWTSCAQVLGSSVTARLPSGRLHQRKLAAASADGRLIVFRTVIKGHPALDRPLDSLEGRRWATTATETPFWSPAEWSRSSLTVS